MNTWPIFSLVLQSRFSIQFSTNPRSEDTLSKPTCKIECDLISPPVKNFYFKDLSFLGHTGNYGNLSMSGDASSSETASAAGTKIKQHVKKLLLII